MIKKAEWVIALRYLRTKNKEGFISIVSAFSLIGIALGVATLIIVMSVMSGYETQLVGRILGLNGHLVLKADAEQNFEAWTEELKAIEHVRYVAPLINGQAMMIFEQQARGVLVRGMSAASLLDKPALEDVFDAQAMEFYGNDEGILIGEALARELNVGVGDYVKLIVPQFENLIFGMVPRTKTFRVIGAFDIGMHEYNSTTIFMPLKLAQLLFDQKGSVSEFEIVADQLSNVPLVKERILQKQQSRSTALMDWTLSNQTMVSALRVERHVMFLILSLIILIAAFNIISGLIMLVQDKRRSIAILRTMGLKRRSVLKIFVICGSLVGVAGTLLGTMLGVIFTLNVERIRAFLEGLTGYTLFDPVIYFLTSLPAQLSAKDILCVVLLSIVLTFLATIYPAWRAASVMPAVALRYE